MRPDVTRPSSARLPLASQPRNHPGSAVRGQRGRAQRAREEVVRQLLRADVHLHHHQAGRGWARPGTKPALTG
jgi:hypothetical protein